MWTVHRDASPEDKYLYWCGYLSRSSKASFNLSPDGQHAVIKVLSTYPTEAHLNFLRETFAVNAS